MKKLVIIAILTMFIIGGCAQCREEWRTEWDKALTEEGGK